MQKDIVSVEAEKSINEKDRVYIYKHDIYPSMGQSPTYPGTLAGIVKIVKCKTIKMKLKSQGQSELFRQ